MTKPFDVDEIAKKQQIIDGSKRFFRMIGDVVELGKALEPIVSLERAANEAQARLDNEIVQKQMDLNRLIKSRTDWLASVGIKG